MTVYTGTIEMQSKDHMPDFHNITDEVKKIVEQSGVKNGICVVYSHHTTCSVMTQECSHDTTYFGREHLQQDLINIMEKIVPTCRHEGQYLHPGPKHIESCFNLARRRAQRKPEYRCSFTVLFLRTFGNNSNNRRQTVAR